MKILFSTDHHLQTSTIEIFRSLLQQERDYAIQNNIKHIFWLGDIFDSRVAQRQDVLNALCEELQKYKELDLTLHCIAGNHDKTDYESEISFLTSYKYQFHLVEKYESVILDSCKIHMIPFFSDNVWLQHFNCVELDSDCFNILLSHLAVTGSRNNDGTVVESNINPTLLSSFNAVFLGHYHNYQKIGDNIYHIPSIYQHNYGENDFKGLTVFDTETLEVDVVETDFVKYIKVDIDVNEQTSNSDIVLQINQWKEDFPNEKLRFNLVGEKTRVDALRQNNEIKSLGDIKIKDVSLDITNIDLTSFNKINNLKDSFVYFCESKCWDIPDNINKIVTKRCQ